MLELEKQRIEQDSELLKQEKNKESDVWQTKVESMQKEHQQVVNNLQNVNMQYEQQVEENESLKNQLSQMQKQHSEMMNRFEMIEQKIN